RLESSSRGAKRRSDPVGRRAPGGSSLPPGDQEPGVAMARRFDPRCNLPYPPFPHWPRHGVSGTVVSGGLPSAQANTFETTHSAIARRVLTEAEPTWGRST